MLSTKPTYNPTENTFQNFRFSDLTHAFILSHSATMTDTGSGRFFTIHPDMIVLNSGSFTNPGGSLVFPSVLVEYRKEKLITNCGCNNAGNKQCAHQAQVLYNIMERPDLRIFFDDALRHEKIKAVAQNYGLQNETNPDEHFELTWANVLHCRRWGF